MLFQSSGPAEPMEYVAVCTMLAGLQKHLCMPRILRGNDNGVIQLSMYAPFWDFCQGSREENGCFQQIVELCRSRSIPKCCLCFIKEFAQPFEAIITPVL
jgi:hypothetical protein